MATLGDLAKLVRSKNAGPFWLTIDIMFDDADAYRRARDAEIVNLRLPFAERCPIAGRNPMADSLSESTIIPISPAVAEAINEGIHKDGETPSAREQDSAADRCAGPKASQGSETVPAIPRQADARGQDRQQRFTLGDIRVGAPRTCSPKMTVPWPMGQRMRIRGSGAARILFTRILSPSRLGECVFDATPVHEIRA